MKFIFALLALGISSVAAQKCADKAAAVPACGATCIETSAKTQGCAAKDYACYCAKQSLYLEAATTCATKACKPDETLKVKPAADAVCACMKG